MARSTLFEGIKFWLSRRIPFYSTFAEDIKKHGGEIVPIERLADMLIVDHLRKDTHLPNSYSYRFIELSIRNGALEDIADHRIQTEPASTRPVGDFNQNIRSTRTPFTRADDDYLIDFLSKTNLALQGDKAFYELEKQNPRHTWQSWRSRWVKRLQHRITLPSAPKSDDMPSKSDPVQHLSTESNGNGRNPITTAAINSSGRPSNSGIKRDAPNNGTQVDPLRSLVEQLGARDESKDSASQPSSQSPGYQQKELSAKKVVPTARRNHPFGHDSSASKPVNGKLPNPGRDQALPPSRPQANPSITTSGQQVTKFSEILKNRVQNAKSKPSTASPNSKQPSSKPYASSSINPKRSSVDEIRVNSPGSDLNADSDVLYPQILVTDDEAETKEPRLTSTRGHTSRSLKKLDVFDLDETMAADIWRELLLQAEGSNAEISEETVTLTANAGIIRVLKDEDFHTAWNMWWHANPEKTEDEWVVHFNSFCVPFYKAHEQDFESLYEQRLANAHGKPRGAPLTKQSVAFGPGSPELGGRTYRIGSQELGDEAYDMPNVNTILQAESYSQHRDTTADSIRATPSRKRTRSFSEVPESPQSPLDSTSTVSSKHRRLEKHAKRNAPHPSSSQRLQQKFIQGHALNTEHGKSHTSDNPEETDVQASIDRQLLLEVEEAGEVQETTKRQKQSHSTITLPAKSLQTTALGYDTATEASGLESHERATEESLFVSEDSQSPSPMSRPMPEPSGVTRNSNAHGPFYEGSEAGIQGNFDDLTSQMADRLESPPFSRLTTPAEVEDYNRTSRAGSRSFIAEDTTDLEREEESVDEWIERQLQEGHSEKVVMVVLHASMMDIGLARKALLYHRKFHRLPNTKPGIWTEEDDTMLLKHSRKGKRDLIEKHGREALDKRREYLATMALAP